MKAKDLMTKDVLTVDKDERLETVLSLMQKHSISKLVATEKGEAVGVVVDGDIADELGALKNAHLPPTQLHVTSVMRRRFPSVTPDADLPQVLQRLLEDDAGMLPVLHDRTCVGVVTGSDLLPLVKSDKPLSDVMTKDLHVVSPSDRVIHARRVMIDQAIERLPVLDNGRLVGILGELDVALGFARLKTVVRDNHQHAALQRFLVEDVMRRQVATAAPETTAREAAVRMKQEDVGSLPVVRGERVVGIVTRSDLLRLINP